MKLELTNIEKEDIVFNYGSNIEKIDIVLNVLNNLDIVEDIDDFYELLCLIALDVETEDNSELNKACGIKRSIQEIIIDKIYEKYENLENLNPNNVIKVKKYINSLENENID